MVKAARLFFFVHIRPISSPGTSQRFLPERLTDDAPLDLSRPPCFCISKRQPKAAAAANTQQSEIDRLPSLPPPPPSFDRLACHPTAL
jgi:hypothetical protein